MNKLEQRPQPNQLGDNQPELAQMLETLSTPIEQSVYYQAVVEACGEAKGEWQIRTTADGWLRVGLPGAERTLPGQGWKLHLSASLISAPAVLAQALPVLLGEAVSFKLAVSPVLLGYLNQGGGGLSQVGKFITIYPENDAQAVRLASALDRVTRGLIGPAILSDRPLAPGSLIYYRYGGFGDKMLQTPLGQLLPALVSPDGVLVADRRETSYQAPAWTQDPFLAAGIALELPVTTPIIAGRYYCLGVLHRSPRGVVYLALDLNEARRCILKQTARAASVGADGHDGWERLRHEAEIMRQLAPDPRFPACYELFEQDDALYLAMEDIAGKTLSVYINQLGAQNKLLSNQEIAGWGHQLAALLGAVHAHGLVYRDLKATNVIVNPDGVLRLIDFELAHPMAATEPPFGLGTRGYSSPQQTTGQSWAYSDDIYSFGALLYFIATGVEPSLAPNAARLLERPLELLNPALSPALARLIERSLEPDPANRPASMKEITTQLEQASTSLAITRISPPRPGHADTSAHYRELARRLGDTLVQVSLPSGEGRTWRSTHQISGGIICRDLNTGAAGPVLALAELVAELNEPDQRETLAAGAKWLNQSPRSEGAVVPGLYVGEAGVGAALLRAGQVLRDETLVEAALERGRQLRAWPYGSPDLFNGTAGRLRFHLWLWDETRQSECLDAALEAGQVLLEAAQPQAAGELAWPIPAGYESMSGQTLAGYAHGAAGIADSLLDLYETSQQAAFLQAALGAARYLARLAIPVLEDGAGADWPSVPGGSANSGLWCHGAAGVGRLWLHLARLNQFDLALDWAKRAALTVATSRRAGPVQCHGLAGNIEYLLDIYQATGDQLYLEAAFEQGRLLEAFKLERGSKLVWPSESPLVVTPDYMVGYAGVAACLLRLSAPARLPHQLSRQNFKRLASTTADLHGKDL